MGERKGQNFYYPPDFDPVKHGNLNRYHGVHALRERAAKIDQGILIIRFEMPFNIWCLGCENHVGMGVRYNAEKTKVGMYYSTPLYEFKMRCHLCQNYFIIRTDPKNFDYELVEGCKRQERRWDVADNLGGVAQTSREDAQKLATDAMFKLEHGEKDQLKAKADVPRIEKIEEIQMRTKDDFLANQILRKEFREKKKEMKAESASAEALRLRCCLPADIAIVKEHDDDKKFANLLAKYKPHKDMEERQAEKRQEVKSQSIFSGDQGPSASKDPKSSLLLKSVVSVSTRKRTSDKLGVTKAPLVKIKQKQQKIEVKDEMEEVAEFGNETELLSKNDLLSNGTIVKDEKYNDSNSVKSTVLPLVDYGSDSSSDDGEKKT